MKRHFIALSLTACLFISCENAHQILQQVSVPPGSASGGLTTNEIVNGLKEALKVGTDQSTARLSNVDGFLKNAAVKILLPEEVVKVENTLRNIGLGSVVDNAVTSLNRAAEDAAKQAAPIFKNAITSMSITDALGILRGGKTAATDYLKAKTTAQLISSFKPVIANSLDKVSATKYWTQLTSAYNQFSANKINTDLSAYVTEKALQGIFLQVAEEEAKIRENPVARTTEILKKVFGSKEAQEAK